MLPDSGAKMEIPVEREDRLSHETHQPKVCGRHRVPLCHCISQRKLATCRRPRTGPANRQESRRDYTTTTTGGTGTKETTRNEFGNIAKEEWKDKGGKTSRIKYTTYTSDLGKRIDTIWYRADGTPEAVSTEITPGGATLRPGKLFITTRQEST